MRNQQPKYQNDLVEEEKNGECDFRIRCRQNKKKQLKIVLYRLSAQAHEEELLGRFGMFRRKEAGEGNLELFRAVLVLKEHKVLVSWDAAYDMCSYGNILGLRFTDSHPSYAQYPTRTYCLILHHLGTFTSAARGYKREAFYHARMESPLKQPQNPPQSTAGRNCCGVAPPRLPQLFLSPPSPFYVCSPLFAMLMRCHMIMTNLPNR